MKMTRTEEKLMSAMTQMAIIDCHEHLPPEADRTSVPQDVFTLFSHYTRFDLFSAGMDREAYEDVNLFGPRRPVHESLFDVDIPLDKRWQIFKPYWAAIRYGSYARAALVTAREVYGVHDIADSTYHILSERITAENTPGIYRRMLCDRCNIRAALTQCSRTDVGPPLVPLMPIGTLADVRTMQSLVALAEGIWRAVPKSVEEYLEVVDRILDRWIAQGTVGLKTRSCALQPPDRGKAETAFRHLLDRGDVSGGDAVALSHFLVHSILDKAATLDLVVAVHAGIWGDFRDIDSKHMLRLAPAHPRTNFDLYHLGMPSVRDTIVVAKNLPNVHLNLCWCHIISQAQTRSGIDELLDHVPVNKILAFGGDYHRPVEKVVGHLHMAREDFARVLGARIDRAELGYEDALHLLKLWFWDNPLRLYKRLEMAEEYGPGTDH